MTWLIETPSGTSEIEPGLTSEDIALEILAALLNDQEPWCRTRVEGRHPWVNQYTVMERGEGLTPTKIAVRQFDGEVSIFDNSRQE